MLRKFLLLTLLLPIVAAFAAPTWSGDPAIGKTELDQEWQKIEHPSATVGIRGIFRFMVETAGLDWHPESIDTALALARSMQDLDPQSKTYGNFKWRRDHDRVIDLNAVEFSIQQAAFLRLRYAKVLTPEGLRRLDEILTTAIEGMHRHAVPPSYTNIFVMKGWNLIATGEALGRPDIAEEGYKHFTDWVNWTVINGISEYGAVTYYGVDLDSLALIAKYAARPDGRAMAETALRYMWTDIAANWWAPGDRLGGANSRSYDYLYGRGYLEAHTWTAGWLRNKPELEGAGWLPGPKDDLTTMLEACTWVPPEELTARIRSHIPRTIVQRWSYRPLEQRATQYISSHVSIASSGGTHGSDERTLVANIGDSPSIPQLTLFMDGRGDPFGTHKTENAANEAKALHLTPFIATIQNGPEVLQLLSDEPLGPKSHRKHGDLSCFNTQFTLPAKAEVWLGNARIEPGTPDSPKEIPEHPTIFVRLGDAVIGVRFLLTVADNGKAAPIYFVSDSPRLPARRITVVHSSQEPKGRGTTLVWMRVADGLDEAGFAAFRHRFEESHASAKLHEGDLRAEVTGLTTTLGMHVDVNAGLRHELAGSEPDALLSINGEDIGQEMLEMYGAK